MATAKTTKAAPKATTTDKAVTETKEAVAAVKDMVEEKAKVAKDAVTEKAMAAKSIVEDKAKVAKAAVSEKAKVVEAKAKEAYTAGVQAFDEAKALTMGNVDAVVASGKVLGTGLKGLGEDYVKAGKLAANTVSADVKGLTGVKTAQDFFKLQTGILARNMETMVAFGTKQADSMYKLGKDTAAPLSKRVSVVADKIRKAA
jgi:hypothetical protein